MAYAPVSVGCRLSIRLNEWVKEAATIPTDTGTAAATDDDAGTLLNG